MAIISALQSAALRIAGRRPASFFGSNDTLEMEICDLVNEVAKDICEYQDWQKLVRVESLTGGAGQEEFDLPDDYDRMLQDADIQDLQSWAWGYSHITNINDFLYYKQRGWGLTPGNWIIYGGKMHFWPAPAGNASFPYVSKNYALDAATLERKPQFTADTDEFIPADSRLLTLGLVWRWRENKGIPINGADEAFYKAIGEDGTNDAGSRVIRTGGTFPHGVPAWPWVRV